MQQHTALNDPAWVRFAGESANLVVRGPCDKPIVSTSEKPTNGVGGFKCKDCTDPHITLALVIQGGTEINVNMAPETGAEICKALVEKLSEVGASYLALKGMRALTLATELAGMTDSEADELDGAFVREWAQCVVGSGPMLARTLPRLYNDLDRERAAKAMGAALDGKIHELAEGEHHIVRSRRLAMVDAVAEALGMKRVGG